MKCPKCGIIGFSSKINTHIYCDDKKAQIGFNRKRKGHTKHLVTCNRIKCDFEEYIWVKVEVQRMSTSKIKYLND